MYWPIVGIPMGTNCAYLIADFSLFSYERSFMLSLLKQMVNQIYPNKFQLNKTNSFGTDAPFLNLDSIDK